MVGTLKPYYMQNNLFQLYLLTGSRDTKTLGASDCTWAQVLVPSLSPEPPGETFTNYFNCLYQVIPLSAENITNSRSKLPLDVNSLDLDLSVAVAIHYNFFQMTVPISTP